MGDAIVADKRIQLFGSKEYHFLSWLKSQERETSRGAAVNFSQEEIAAEYGSRIRATRSIFWSGNNKQVAAGIAVGGVCGAAEKRQLPYHRNRKCGNSKNGKN